MITKHDIIKMAKHVVRRGKGRPDGRIMHPERDWFFGFLAAAVLFLGGVAYAGFVFYSAWQYNPDAVEVDVAAVVYEKDLIREVTERYKAREQAFRALRREPAAVGTTTPTIAPDDIEPESGDAAEIPETAGGEEAPEATEPTEGVPELAS